MVLIFVLGDGTTNLLDMKTTGSESVIHNKNAPHHFQGVVQICLLLRLQQHALQFHALQIFFQE